MIGQCVQEHGRHRRCWNAADGFRGRGKRCPGWLDRACRGRHRAVATTAWLAAALPGKVLRRCRVVAVARGVNDPPKGGRVGPRPEKLHHPRFPMPSACKPTLTRPGGRIAMAPRSSTRAIARIRLRCTASCSSMPRVPSPRPKRPPVPGCRNSSKKSSTPAWSAASWRTASCACAATTATTTSWSRSAASAGGFAPRVGPGAWRRRTTSSARVPVRQSLVMKID